jgi:hypothetical protein
MDLKSDIYDVLRLKNVAGQTLTVDVVLDWKREKAIIWKDTCGLKTANGTTRQRKEGSFNG